MLLWYQLRCREWLAPETLDHQVPWVLRDLQEKEVQVEVVDLREGLDPLVFLEALVRQEDRGFRVEQGTLVFLERMEDRDGNTLKMI